MSDNKVKVILRMKDTETGKWIELPAWTDGVSAQAFLARYAFLCSKYEGFEELAEITIEDME